jgi:hypothetical protein
LSIVLLDHVCKLASAHDRDQDLIEMKNIDRNSLSGVLPEINSRCIVWNMQVSSSSHYLIVRVKAAQC